MFFYNTIKFFYSFADPCITISRAVLKKTSKNSILKFKAGAGTACALVLIIGEFMKNTKGFTLIELMIVVTIMGIIGAIGAFSVTRALPGYQLQKAAREMVTTLRKARSMAIKLNRPVPVAFYVNMNQYAIDGRSALDGNQLPESAATSKSLTQYYGSGVRLGFPGRSDCVHFTKGGADAGDTITFNTTGLTANEMIGYVYIQNRDSHGSKVGYRIGVTSLAGNIRMDQCGSKDASGVKITCLE